MPRSFLNTASTSTVAHTAACLLHSYCRQSIDAASFCQLSQASAKLFVASRRAFLLVEHGLGRALASGYSLGHPHARNGDGSWTCRTGLSVLASRKHLSSGRLNGVIDEHIQDLEPHIGIGIKNCSVLWVNRTSSPKSRLSNAVMPPVFMLARCVSSP